ncbi:phosphotransferase [Sulfurimonas sp.]
MGVKTTITLLEAQKLFPSFKIVSLQATTDGVMDTTYILDNYVLKKYERDIQQKIQTDKKVLALLQRAALNVPTCVAQNKEWYLYEKLQGEMPKTLKLFHIQSLARFMSQMHKQTKKIQTKHLFLKNYEISELLKEIKQSHFFYFKKLHSLSNYSHPNDGFIHGDIFQDNTLFKKDKIAVFDFIDGGDGSFVFDIAVALLSFNPHNKKTFQTQFLKTYNQNAPYKISQKQLHQEISNAAKFYSLLRIHTHNNTHKAKLLSSFW